MYDKVPCHRACAIECHLYHNEIQWSVQSLDLDPIYNVWSVISKAITRDKSRDKSSAKVKLIRYVFCDWANIAPARVHGLYDTLHKLVRKIVDKNVWGELFVMATWCVLIIFQQFQSLVLSFSCVFTGLYMHFKMAFLFIISQPFIFNQKTEVGCQ